MKNSVKTLKSLVKFVSTIVGADGNSIKNTVKWNQII